MATDNSEITNARLFVQVHSTVHGDTQPSRRYTFTTYFSRKKIINFKTSVPCVKVALDIIGNI